MKPSHLLSFLSVAIPARLPVLITGAPGIGKSEIVAQATDAAGATLILSHPVVDDPTDAKGMPWVSNGVASHVPFGEARRALEATTPTVWMLDDLGQASPAVQASYMQWILARQVNSHTLPDCVTFIAATNRRTDRAGVTGILEPVKSRFAAIIELTADLDDWCQWAITTGSMPPELIAFLRFRPDLLSNFSPTADLTNSPMPRTWTHVAHLQRLNLPRTIQSMAFAGAVGEGPAVEYLSFLRLCGEMPSLDHILADPYDAPIKSDPALLYATTTGLAARATVENIEQLVIYAGRLVEAEHGEFATLLMRDAVRRDGRLVETAAFIRLASGPFGQLLIGH